jgi:TonB family protein
MRGAVTASAIVHLALMGVLMVLQARAPQLMIGPDVIQLALLEMPASNATPAPAPERAVVKAPELVREPGTGVKVAPEKPKTPPKAAPAPERAPEARPLAVPLAPLGRPGLSGDVAVDAGNFEFSYYLLLLRNRIAASWTPPAGITGGGQPVRAVVYFRVMRDGTVRDVRLESASTAEFFDRSAMRAVALSDPMPPLPEGYAGAALGVHFGFEYTAP